MNKEPGSSRELFLKKQEDFTRVKLQGERIQTPFFHLLYCESSGEKARVGIIVGRRFGKAVLRNRAKRIFREMVRLSSGSLGQGKDFIVYPRRAALSVKFKILLDTWICTLNSISMTTLHAPNHP